MVRIVAAMASMKEGAAIEAPRWRMSRYMQLRCVSRRCHTRQRPRSVLMRRRYCTHRGTALINYAPERRRDARHHGAAMARILAPLWRASRRRHTHHIKHVGAAMARVVASRHHNGVDARHLDAAKVCILAPPCTITALSKHRSARPGDVMRAKAATTRAIKARRRRVSWRRDGVHRASRRRYHAHDAHHRRAALASTATRITAPPCAP